MITEAAKLEIIALMQSGSNPGWTEIAQKVESKTGYKYHRSTIQRWYDREGQWAEDILSDSSDMDDATAKAWVKLETKLATHAAESKHYKKLYKLAISSSANQNLVLEAIQRSTPALSPVTIPSFKRGKAKNRAAQPQTMVAPLTDTHVGDRVLIEEMNGLNEYNIDIFGRRLHGWVGQIVDLVTLRRNFAEVPDLVVPMLGDMISGDIHDELARTNIDNCMNQMIRGAYMISQALMELAASFETVHVPAVVGNHGRMTNRVPAKDRNMDWDYMLYQWVAAFCKAQKNISFHIPKSPFTVFDAAGHNILIMHGDSVPGGGSSASLTNVVHRLRTALQYKETAAVEVPLDIVDSRFEAVMMGHYHRVDEMDVGTGQVFICGTMKGGDEYALNRLHLMTEAKQIVTYWSEKHGYIGKEIVYLNQYDHAKGTYDDVSESTWING